MAMVTREGRVTLPREVRRALGIEAGAEVDFELRPDGVLMRRTVPRQAFERWRGYLKLRGVEATTDELMTELREQ